MRHCTSVKAGCWLGAWVARASIGLLPGSALAHSPMAAEGAERWAALLTALLLLLLWLAYGIGSLRRRPRRAHAVCFHGAMLLCWAAALGPLDDWAVHSAAAHMVQHMLFMVVIAPLWVLAQPLPQLAVGSSHLLDRAWRLMLMVSTRPMLAAWLHALVIWFWHTPFFYRLALENPWWHAIEHALFLGSAGLFWWAVLHTGRLGAGWALLALLLTLMHTGFLGALLSFARAPLYGDARDLADQQLAGLIMWVLGGLPYMAASIWVGRRWYRLLRKRTLEG